MVGVPRMSLTQMLHATAADLRAPALILAPIKRHAARFLTDPESMLDGQADDGLEHTVTGTEAVKKDFSLPGVVHNVDREARSSGLISSQVVRGDSPGPAWLLR